MSRCTGCSCCLDAEAERDALIRERDNLAKGNALAERHISRLGEYLGGANDALEEAESLCNSLMTAGSAECEMLRTERDGARGQRNASNRRIVELSTERDALIRERDSWSDMARRQEALKDHTESYAEEYYDRMVFAESLISALMTAGLEECDRLRETLDETKIDYHNACDVGRRLEIRYDALERQRDSLANESVELRRIAKEADNVVCWGVDCVHQANALDIVAKAEGERAALCDRIVELVTERDAARRQMVDMKRELDATINMTDLHAELGIAKRRIAELEGWIDRVLKAEEAESGFANAMYELRRVATGKE